MSVLVKIQLRLPALFTAIPTPLLLRSYSYTPVLLFLLHFYTQTILNYERLLRLTTTTSSSALGRFAVLTCGLVLTKFV